MKTPARGPVISHPYRQAAERPPIPRELADRIEWEDTELILLEQARRANDEANDYYAFRDALPSLGGCIVRWLALA